MRLFEFNHDPAVLYHGTKTGKSARGILKYGIRNESLDAKYGGKARAAMAPVAGHSYLTPSLKYACIYALGGNMVGMDYRIREGDERYGYVFVVDRADLHLQPDEDELGFAVREAPDIIAHHRNNKGEIKHTRHLDNLVFGQALNDNLEVAYFLKSLADRYLTDTQKDRIWNDYRYDAMAQVGKKLLKVMPQELKDRLVQMGCHVSTPDVVEPREAWKLDKKKSNLLGFQGEHFFEVAQRIK